MSLEMVGLPTPEETNGDTVNSTVDATIPSDPSVGVTVVADSTGNNESPEVTEQTIAEQQAQVDEVLEALIGAIAPAHLATQHMKIFVYGANGCGKTVFAAQSPGPLIADCDKEGAISLLNFPTLKATKVMPVRSIFAAEQLVKYLKKGEPRFDWVETLISTRLMI
jgi:hypothetical protein